MAQNILPRKKDELGPSLLGDTQRQPCGQVIWLLIHVNNVRPEFCNPLPERGPMVQMIVSVEAQRLNPQLIPVCVLALKLNPAGRIVPVGGHHHRKINIRMTADGAEF